MLLKCHEYKLMKASSILVGLIVWLTLTENDSQGTAWIVNCPTRHHQKSHGRLIPNILLATPTTEEEEESAFRASVETTLSHAIQVMSQVMTDEFFTQSNVLRPLHAKLTKPVEVRESPIHGLGLFATKAIKANTLVSFYPAHALGIDNGRPFVSNDDNFFQTHDSTSSDYLHCTDQPIFQRDSILASSVPENNNNVPVYLDINPQIPMVAPWVSQFINDGASVTTQSEAGVLEYYQASNAKRNCIHIPFGPSPILATVTTKKVKKGDELLTTYGGVYWTSNASGNNDVPITPAISAEIQASARDLTSSIQKVATLYANQLDALQQEFQSVWDATV